MCVCVAGMEKLGERIFYTGNFHMVAFYRHWHISGETPFTGSNLVLKFGAARGRNAEMQLKTEILFVPQACNCTYL